MGSFVGGRVSALMVQFQIWLQMCFRYGVEACFASPSEEEEEEEEEEEFIQNRKIPTNCPNVATLGSLRELH